MRHRPAFTVLETVAVLGLLVVALGLVAQIAAWSLHERDRAVTRQDVLETAVNVLEAARARPWESLTPEWARTQRLPNTLAPRLRGGRLTVKVEPEAARPHLKRVTVEVGWDTGPGRPVRLVGLFSARSAENPGARP